MGGPAGGTSLDTAQKKKLLWGAKKVGGSPLQISISCALNPLDTCVAAAGSRLPIHLSSSFSNAGGHIQTDAVSSPPNPNA